MYEGDVTTSGPESYDAFWTRANTEFKFVWWPVKSYESGNRIWLQKAYRFRRSIKGLAGDEAIHEDRWMTPPEAMIHILKG